MMLDFRVGNIDLRLSLSLEEGSLVHTFLFLLYVFEILWFKTVSFP
jgi:hypothetical protein